MFQAQVWSINGKPELLASAVVKDSSALLALVWTAEQVGQSHIHIVLRDQETGIAALILEGTNGIWRCGKHTVHDSLKPAISSKSAIRSFRAAYGYKPIEDVYTTALCLSGRYKNSHVD
ncbi:MAG: hypothetical protein QXS54_03095 [Candidatus Methanomethylicaceae archaeon]